MKRETLSNADLALLRLDSVDNLMVVTAVLILDAPLPVEGLKAAIDRSLLCFNRFRQQVAFPPFAWQKPYWEEDPAFDLDAHVVCLHTPVRADQQLLQELIGKLMSVGLDLHRPLWQFFLLEHFGEGSVVVARFHHGLADGMALLRLLISLTEEIPCVPVTEQERAPGSSGESVTTARRLARAGIKAATDWSYAMEQTRLGQEIAVAMGKLLLTAPDPYPFFRGQLGVPKCVAWSEPIPLEDFKFVGKALGGTVNDVLINALTGALRCYLELRCGSVDQAKIHGFIPVNLRAKGAEAELGNKFGLVLLDLPIGACDPTERMGLLKRQMEALKSSREALAYYGILSLMGRLPHPIQVAAVNTIDTKGTAIITNVAGPQQQLSLSGVPINTLMAWVPQSGRVGLGFSLVSYNGVVRIGVACDKGLVPDPQKIVDCFNQEFEGLKTLAQGGAYRKNKSIQEMLASLDQAMQSIDSLYAEKGQVAPDGGGDTFPGAG